MPVRTPEFHYTTDFGASWKSVGGLPRNGYPLTLASDDDYLYCAVYCVKPEETESGLWRLDKKELEQTGVATVDADVPDAVYADGRLTVARMADRMTVYDLSGREVASACGVKSLDVRGISKGVYVYEVSLGGERVTGKFVR